MSSLQQLSFVYINEMCKLSNNCKLRIYFINYFSRESERARILHFKVNKTRAKRKIKWPKNKYKKITMR
jgi:hypothetical protein